MLLLSNVILLSDGSDPLITLDNGLNWVGPNKTWPMVGRISWFGLYNMKPHLC